MHSRKTKSSALVVITTPSVSWCDAARHAMCSVCGQAGVPAHATLPGTGLAAPILSLVQTSPCTAAQLLSSSPDSPCVTLCLIFPLRQLFPRT